MPLNIVDVSTFTDPIVAPADADPADATYVRTIAQGCANRTRFLVSKIGGTAGTDEWLYPTPKERVILISLAGAKSAIDHNGTSGLVTVCHHWDQITTDEWRSRKDFGVLLVPLNPYLIQGCDILRVRAVVTSGADRAGANRMSVTLKKVTADFDGPSAGAVATMAGGGPLYEAETYTAAAQVITSGASGAIDLTVNRFGVDHYLSIVAGSDGGSNFDKVHAVEITVRDYGPRNF